MERHVNDNNQESEGIEDKGSAVGVTAIDHFYQKQLRVS